MTLLDAFGAGAVKIETPVIIPSVPSEPIKSCFKSYPGLNKSSHSVKSSLSFIPVLSFRKTESWSRMVPSGSTTSNPRTDPCRDPYRNSRSPPALVATFPPI
jgi:hypothetical protein